ncbi:MAG: AgmX/PglI C-terminal domain-containing protein [Bacteroidetes bacterium]|nr:AgmX/PglI C-terminal domain-containing protein [Bacteroidota bacterium]
MTGKAVLLCLMSLAILSGPTTAQLKAPPLSQPAPLKKDEKPVNKGKAGKKSTGNQRDPNDLTAVVSSHDQEMRLLFEQYRFKDPNLSGKIEFLVSIKADGTVQSVKKLQSTLKNPAFEKSLSTRIKLWKFPQLPPKSPTQTVKVPYVFAR